MQQLSKSFPPGIHYKVAFNTTDFVAESVAKSSSRCCLSIFLVVLVIYVFLQNPRSTLIPAVTIPVSLIGTFFVMKIFGFTINTITLFGLTLATGLVVDDAIVVIENIARHIEMNKGRQSGVASAAEAMREIQSAVVASSLVLLAVFVPVAFFPGTTGQLYKQFALTIAAAITISLFQALTLAPVMSARLLSGETESTFVFFRWFNTGLARFRRWYGSELPRAFRYRWLVMFVFAIALMVTLFMFVKTPSSFIPAEDQGYFIVLIQAPEGTSLASETAISEKAEQIIRSQPQVLNLFNVGGFSFSGAAPNRGLMFCLLKPWGQRKGADDSIDAVIQRSTTASSNRFRKRSSSRSIRRQSTASAVLADFSSSWKTARMLGLPVLMKTAYEIMGAAAQDPRLRTSSRSSASTRRRCNSTIDRNKAKAIGISLTDIFDTLRSRSGVALRQQLHVLESLVASRRSGRKPVPQSRRSRCRTCMSARVLRPMASPAPPARSRRPRRLARPPARRPPVR